MKKSGKISQTIKPSVSGKAGGGAARKTARDPRAGATPDDQPGTWDENRMIKSMLDSLQVLVSCCDSQRRYRYVNRAYEEMFGVSSADLVGRTVREVLGDNAYDLVKKHIDDVLSGREVTCENSIELDNGKQVRFEGRYVPYKNSRGETAGYTVVIRDVTELRHAEERLRASEEQYRGLVDEAPEAIMWADTDGNQIGANRAAEKLLGYTHEELVSMHISENHPPDAREAVKAIFQEAGAGEPGGPKYFRDVPMLRKNGSVVHVDLSGSYIILNGKKILQAVFKDVTERKRAYDALASSEAKYRTLFDSIPMKIFYKNVDSVYMAVNRALAEDAPTGEDFFVGRKDLDLFPPELAEKYVADDKIVISTATRLECEEKYIENGIEFHVHTAKVPVRDATGRTSGVLGMFSDITARKRTEEALRAAKARLDFLLSSSPSVIYTCRFGGDWAATFMSDNLKDMLGYEPKENIETPGFWIDRIHPDDLPNILEGLKSLEGKNDHVHEYRFRRKDGSWRWMLDRLRVVRDENGRAVECVGSWMDITERKATEEELEKYRLHLENLVEERTAALAESERKYRIVADNTHDWEFWAAPSGAYIYVSPACRNITGYEASEFMNNKSLLLKIIHPEDRHLFAEHRRSVRKGRDEGKCSFRITHRDGRRIWIEHVCRPVFDEAGRYMGTRGSNRDITDRKAASDMLAGSEARYRRLLKSVTDYIYTVEMENGKPVKTRHGAGCFAVTGYTSEEYEACPLLWHQMIYEADRERVMKSIESMISGGEIAAVEHRIIHKSGSTRWIRHVSMPLWYENGKLLAYEGTISDITERKEAEEKLRVSEEKYRLLFEESKDGIIISSSEGSIMDANPAALAMFGFDGIGEAKRVNISRDIYCNPLHRKMMLSRIERDGYIKDWRVQLRKKSGEPFHVLITSSAVRGDDGSTAFYRSVIRDISDQTRLEREIAEISEQERMKFGHELHDGVGQSLSGLAFMCKALERRLLEKNIPEWEEVSNMTYFLNDAINRVRAVSRGICPVKIQQNALPTALMELAANTERIYFVNCVCLCEGNNGRLDQLAAEQLYFIAGEAVVNALRHGGARNIAVSLISREDITTLEIRDDGVGFGERHPDDVKGLGMRIMRYRAGIIGAALEIGRTGDGKTRVFCTLNTGYDASETT